MSQQPDKPAMVMELWSGWFDRWNEIHLTRNQMPLELGAKVGDLLDRSVSMNFYMFHGKKTVLSILNFPFSIECSN